MTCIAKQMLELENHITDLTAGLSRSRHQVLRVLASDALTDEQDVRRAEEALRLLQEAESVVHEIGSGTGFCS